MEIIIRKTNQAEEAFNIAKKLPDYFDENGLKQIEQDTKEQLLYGAFLEKEMVGFAIYKPVNEDTVEMTWIGILSDKQGLGIGSGLVNQSLRDFSPKYKVCEVKTLSETDDYVPYIKTRDFYKKLGFVPIETIDPYPNWSDPCQIFVKFIEKTNS